MNPNIIKPLLSVFLAGSVLCLSLSSISTLAAGLTWLLMTLTGICAWLGRTNGPQPDPLSTPVLATRWWVLACTAAFVLMLIPTAYWGGPWPERHPQWRLLIGALGLWLWLKHDPPLNKMIDAMATATALSLLLGLGLVLTRGADLAPTNRIPWMAGLSLLSCSLLALTYQQQSAPVGLRRFWFLASALTLVTALLSGVRGSWGLWLVWPLAWLCLQRHDKTLWRWTPLRIGMLGLVLVTVIGLGNQAIPERDRPFTRIHLMWQELGIDHPTSDANANSSAGIRQGIYKAGLEQVIGAPSWLGVGHEKHKQSLKAHVMALNASEMLDVIGHYHSDALNAWAEFGLFGLLGYLSYAVGMVAVLWHCQQMRDWPTCAGLGAVLVMHLSTGLSNANFAHNYYPTVLSICVGMLLMASMRSAVRR